MDSRLLAAAALAACIVPPASAQWSSHQPAPSTKVPATIASTGGTTALTGGADDCSAPRLISGAGPHSFDTTAATTGAQGQAEAICNFFAQIGIANDVWFQWTAGASGNAVVQTCTQTGMDSKIAVYAGGGCPGGAAIACNDDACGLQTSVSFPAVAGNTYMIQLGNYPGAAAGTGTFTVNVTPPPGPCTALDDGSTNNSVGLTAGGAIAWLQRFGPVSGSTTVTSIQSAFGSLAFPTSGPPDGTAVIAHIWDDPNDDGNPSDGVLLQSVPGVVAGLNTDAFTTFNLAPSVTVNGYFFVGVQIVHAASQFPAPLDQPVNPASGNAAWAVGNTTGVLDVNTLTNNDVPPIALSTIGGLDGQWLLRVSCGGSAFTVFCEPGQAGVLACPCGNPGAAGRGCDNSATTGGALLVGSGNPSLSNDTVSLTSSGELPSALTIFLQGDIPVAGGIQFGQGVRCAGGNLLRLYSLNASSGTATVPGGGQSVSARAIALGDALGAGSTRDYQAYYRDPNVLGGCNPLFTWNVSQGLRVTWTP